jgi:hypothetical protein
VYAIPQLDRPSDTRLVGSLDVYVHTVLMRPLQAGAQPGGIFDDVRRFGRQLNTLRFCINDLMPLLRTMRRSPERVAQSEEPIPEATVCLLGQQTQELLHQIKLPPLELETSEELAKLFGAPCAIVGPTLVPLKPVLGVPPDNSIACVLETSFIPRTDGARALREVLEELKLKRKDRALQRLRDRPELNRMATDLLSEMKRILERRQLEDCGAYQVFHRDSDHQLQHSCGNWILVRGPVASRLDRGDIFVGLPLVGDQRRKWIATMPNSSDSVGGFWGPNGRPTRGYVCMGDAPQYTRLLSKDFTDAEAVVEWLDAGVIVATGRSRLHKQLRDFKDEDHPGRAISALHRMFRTR